MCAVEGGQPPCCKSWAAQCLRIGAPAISGISEGTAHSRWLLNSATSRSGTGKEQLPIADCAPSQRRGVFKAGQISLHSVYHLVSCSPIFQSLCPTNRLCSPPSSSCLCTCISPQAKVYRLNKPQDSPRSVRLRCFLPNDYSLFFFAWLR